MQTSHRNAVSAEAPATYRQSSFSLNSLLGRWSRIVLVAAAALLAVNSTEAAGAVDSARSGRDAFLRAIAEVETGNNPRKVGRLGERGQYQFRQATWRQHTRQPFRDAHNPSIAHAVASRHYDWILQQLERNGKRATPYMVAAAWNSGIGRVTSGRIPAASKDYAQRVVNLASCWSPSIRAAMVTGSAVAVAAN
jgi:soluble lytic murein transglycosylase-like protein